MLYLNLELYYEIKLVSFLGITIYAVGIGKLIEEELRAIASEPVEKHIFYAQEFKAMEEITEKLQKRICEGTK